MKSIIRLNATFSGIARFVFSIIACIRLILSGIFRLKSRLLLFEMCSHFGLILDKRRPEALVPKVSINELLGQSITITLSEINSIDGNISHHELIIIAVLTRKLNPARAFEIGTFDGRTALNIALNQPDGSELFTLDLPFGELGKVSKPIEKFDMNYIIKDKSGERFVNRETSARIVQLYGDSSTFDFTEYKSSTDLIFIDGSHAYESVIHDSLVAMSLIRPNGMIIWHDYNTRAWLDVTKALNYLFTNDADFSTLRHIEDTSLCFLQKLNN